jgi:hypothetical protein
MKKYLSVIFLISFFIFSHDVFANGTGSFQLMDFPPSISCVVGQVCQRYINFVYSGQASPSISLVSSSPLPNGMSINTFPINIGQNGVDYDVWYGTPTTVGDYSLTLILTDNNGVILTQPFDFKVISNTNLVTFTTNSLPDAILNKNYSAVINYSYIGDWGPSIIFGNFPQGFSSTQAINGGGVGSIMVTGTPTKTGTFTFAANAGINATSGPTTDSVSNTDAGNKTYTITVDDPNKPISPPVVVTPAPVVPPPVITVSPTPAVAPTIKISKTKASPVVSVKSTIPTPTSQQIIPQPTQPAQPITPTLTPQKESFFAKVKNFFSHLF